MRALTRVVHEKLFQTAVVTTQAREGIDTNNTRLGRHVSEVTTQAREGIDTPSTQKIIQWLLVTTQAREGIDTENFFHSDGQAVRNNSSP